MTITDIIGGAHAASGASTESKSDSNSSGRSVSSDTSNAGMYFRQWLDDRTPDGVEWNLNFGFIAAVISTLSSIISVHNWVS